jgi:hypothetical protein
MRIMNKATMVLASLMFVLIGATANSQAASPTPKPTPRSSPSPAATPRVAPTPAPTPKPNATPSGEDEGTPAAPFPSPPTSPSPVPMLYLTAQEYYTANGKNWVRYKYDVLNKMQYPAALWAPAPSLPPCGANTNSSRTWVDFFKQDGTRLYGFCALGKPEDLGLIWFALEEGVIPPSWVYIEINDRQTNTKYKSNLAETTP